MSHDQIEITLSKDKLREILPTYKVLGDFLESVLPKEQIYKADFLRGLENALQEVKTCRTRKVTSFDEFVA